MKKLGEHSPMKNLSLLLDRVLILVPLFHEYPRGALLLILLVAVLGTIGVSLAAIH